MTATIAAADPDALAADAMPVPAGAAIVPWLPGSGAIRQAAARFPMPAPRAMPSAR